ncbi:unnamed protein product [Rotaria magnacalcarata]|uniref:Uncharacterized protein n=2 Tax=Rotaria magnacalcarata TaxID=392030 RepID=A0A819QRY9_9BILA|nr:unnamed protein product [Rotaria magnacalcarata]
MNLISLSSSSSSSIVQMEFGLFSSSLSTTSVEYGSSGSTITTEAESGSSSIIIIETERGSSSSSTIIIEQTRAIISQEKNNSSLISLSNRHSSLLPNPYEDDQNGLRNPSTMIKTTENESLRDNRKYSFILPWRKIFLKNFISSVNLDCPSSKKRFLSYINKIGFSATPTVNCPIIDLNIQTNLYDSPLLPQTSVENNSHHTILNELEDKPYNCLIPSSNVQYQQKPVILPKMKIKPAECFAILPTLEVEPFPTKNTLRQKIENSHNQKQILLKISPHKNSKPTTTLSSSVINPSRQINRTVHLRRAHAKAKIEELSQITTKQLHESDILSASCSYSSSSHSKKESTHLQ